MIKKENMHLLGNGYSEILKAINAGSIYVGIDYEVIIHIKKRGENCNY